MYQRYFKNFYETIKVNNFNENRVLREKRESFIDNIEEYIIKNHLPNFESFNLGSYAVNTTVKPIDGKYTMDIGICFDILLEDYKNPIEVKKWVYNALENDTETVEITRYGVTAEYKNEGEVYNINVFIYANNKEGDKLYIAKGKTYSSKENKVWELSNSIDAVEKVSNHYIDVEDNEQFRRIISYLKRWKDLKVTTKGISTSLGFGITMFALEYLEPDKRIGDLIVLNKFVDSIIDNFELVKNDEVEIERLRYTLPMEPKNDIFANMSDLEMDYFKKELSELSNILGKVKEKEDALEGCMLLQDIFGCEFPVPEEESTRNSSYVYA